MRDDASAETDRGFLPGAAKGTARLAIIVAVVGLVPAFVATDVLVRGHKKYRDSLARAWADRGADARAHGDVATAIDALRNVVSLRPGVLANRLALADALLEGRRDGEAQQVLESLRADYTDDGRVNLWLARLAVRRRDRDAAAAYYQAAIAGRWDTDATEERHAAGRELATVRRAPAQR